MTIHLIQNAETGELIHNQWVVRKCKLVVNLWWMQVFRNDKVLIALDNQWLLNLIQKIMKEMLGVEDEGRDNEQDI